jgi:hypothetical protein
MALQDAGDADKSRVHLDEALEIARALDLADTSPFSDIPPG